jgi:CRP-like cAMP-binding protein
MTLSDTSHKPARLALPTRPIAEVPAQAAKAAELLSMRGPGFSLGLDEAASIAMQMRLVHYPAGAKLFVAGDHTNTSYMLLILEGDVSVDTGDSFGAGKVDISVIGIGALIGELALLDGSPRSASCTAITPVSAAALSAAGMQRLLEQHPLVAAKLAIYIARSAGDRLRSLSEQLRMYDQLTARLQLEVDQLRASVKRID